MIIQVWQLVFILFFHPMKHWILGVECYNYMKRKVCTWVFFYNSHNMMQGLKDGRFCSILINTLTVGCLMQLNTIMEKAAKPFVQTTSFNLYIIWIGSAILWVPLSAHALSTIFHSTYFIVVSFFTFTLELTETNLVESANIFIHTDTVTLCAFLY